jgi:sugar phosphate isomerase/epimerase
MRELAELPPNLVGSVQISDAAAEPGKLLIDETMHSRLIPGDGVVDLVGIIRTLDSIGSAAPLGLEVISDEMNALPTAAAAQRAIDALQRIVVQARGAHG